MDGWTDRHMDSIIINQSVILFEGSNQTTNQQLSSMQASLTTNQNLHDGRSGGLAQVVEEVEEEDLMPAMDSMSTEALALAVTESDDDEDTGGISPFPTPGLSKEPSLDNSDDGNVSPFFLSPLLHELYL